MNKLSLQERLVRWLKNNPGWHASGDLEELARKAGYTGSTCSRRARELAEEGTLAVKQIRGHAYYSLKVSSVEAQLAWGRSIGLN